MPSPSVASLSSVAPASLDLTGKARIRQAALQLFANKGYAQASLRRIAQRANVSLALIGHHFGSKVLLREAVDRWIVRRLGEAAEPRLDLRTPLAGLAEQLARSYQSALDTEPEMRAYLRRAVFEDARGDAQVIALFLSQVRDILGQAPDVERASGLDALAPWAMQVFVQVFGPLVLEPALRSDRARHSAREPEPSASADDPERAPLRRPSAAASSHPLRSLEMGVAPLGMPYPR